MMRNNVPVVRGHRTRTSERRLRARSASGRRGDLCTGRCRTPPRNTRDNEWTIIINGLGTSVYLCKESFPRKTCHLRPCRVRRANGHRTSGIGRPAGPQHMSARRQAQVQLTCAIRATVAQHTTRRAAVALYREIARPAGAAGSGAPMTDRRDWVTFRRSAALLVLNVTRGRGAAKNNHLSRPTVTFALIAARAQVSAASSAASASSATTRRCGSRRLAGSVKSTIIDSGEPLRRAMN